MSDLKQRLQDDIKTAMRAKEMRLLGVLRFISATIKQREVDERIVLADEHILAVLDKMTKQRRESMEQFAAAGRDDLVEKEKFELGVIETYLPQRLTAEEIDNLIATAISEQNACSIKDMAKVMAAIKPQVQGRADMAQVSQKIKERLSA